MSYNAASYWCRQLNGHLPIPSSQEENDFLAEIGNTWLAVNTKDLSGLNFTNWRVGEPNGDSDKVQLLVGKQWNADWGFGLWNDGSYAVAPWRATCYLETTGKIA